MKKRAIIVHGWSGNPQEGWFPWLEKEITTAGLEVSVPAMPDADHPKIEPWVQTLVDTIGTPDANTILIGHSIGAQTILRYLETVSTPIGGAVFVAPWLTLSLLGSEENWQIAE
ncbi:MAG: alpha/beta fold hydrolase, partial [Patescibacteria group bacterium]